MKKRTYLCEAKQQGRHSRERTLTRNIRERRGSKVEIHLPIYKDVATPTPFLEAYPDARPDHVYLDAMGFGMGSSCLQVGFLCSVFCVICSLACSLISLLRGTGDIPGLTYRRSAPSVRPTHGLGPDHGFFSFPFPIPEHLS